MLDFNKISMNSIDELFQSWPDVFEPLFFSLLLFESSGILKANLIRWNRKEFEFHLNFN